MLRVIEFDVVDTTRRATPAHLVAIDTVVTAGARRRFWIPLVRVARWDPLVTAGTEREETLMLYVGERVFLKGIGRGSSEHRRGREQARERNADGRKSLHRFLLVFARPGS
jgi:hypothetical protein